MSNPPRRKEELITLKATAVRMIQEGLKNKVIRDRTGLDWKVIRRIRNTYDKVEGKYGT